jgi:hypothetical protein
MKMLERFGARETDEGIVIIPGSARGDRLHNSGVVNVITPSEQKEIEDSYLPDNLKNTNPNARTKHPVRKAQRGKKR